MNDPRLRVWALRLAAPLAFFIAATVLVILIDNGLSGGSTRTTPSPTVSVPSIDTGTTTTKKKKKIYRVKAGDTLESIAEKFETTVDDLLALNPGIDPLALSPGQRIRVS
ncbi:MAG: LysM peptidoglycan-binding domain-containing protein [Gaiellaceae bacterium]